jgi:hypothetical protein
MKEEVIQFDDEFLLNDSEPFFKLIGELDGEYEAKWYEPIFDTPLFVGVDYHFDFAKLLALFKDYEKKYSAEKPLFYGTNYNSYEPTKNGGVYDIDYGGLKHGRINEILNEDGTLTSNITVEAEGGKYDGWSSEQAVFRVMLFKYNYEYANTCNYAKFTSLEKLKEFFADLQSCVVSLDTDELKNRIKSCEDEIKKNEQCISKLQRILNTD